MELIKNFMKRVGRHRIIMDRQSNEPYLERYYVFLKNRDWFPFNIFVHKFLKSDEITLHDHPWPYATLILWGGYWEWTPVFDFMGNKYKEIRTWCGVGSLRVCGATSYHRVELEPGVTPWTLFMPGVRKREWGFLVNNRWIQHEEYISQKSTQCRKLK